MTSIVNFHQTNLGRCLLDIENSATELAKLLCQFSLVENSDQGPSIAKGPEAANQLHELASSCVSATKVLREEIIHSQRSQQVLFLQVIESLVSRIETLKKDQNRCVDALLSDVRDAAYLDLT